LLHLSIEILDIPAVYNYIYDDRRADNRGDGIERQYGVAAGHYSQHITQKRNASPCKQGNGQQLFVVGGSEKQARNVRYGQTDEGNRAAKSSSGGSKNAGA